MNFPDHLLPTSIQWIAHLLAALAIAATGLAASLLLGLSGVYAFDYLRSHYLPYYVLMGWSEAMTTGMIMTLMVIYRPLWVSTFDDARYLNR